jgi:hypothetical protein
VYCFAPPCHESATHTTGSSDLFAFLVIATVQCLAQLVAVSQPTPHWAYPSLAAGERAVGSMDGRLDQRDNDLPQQNDNAGIDSGGGTRHESRTHSIGCI